MKLPTDHKILSLFVTAGFPDLKSTVPLVPALARAGADVIEIGIPFSDPIADGPTIQRSSEIALRNGVTLRKTLEMVKDIRRESAVPIVLMGYANPVYAYGMERFLESCSAAGCGGTIIADLPLEESDQYRAIAARTSIDTIFLATPTTPAERLVRLDEASRGFLYCVSVTGVTGERQLLASQAESFLQRARTHVTRNPLLVGFGIATTDDAKRIAALSDGVIIGSALVKLLDHAAHNGGIESAVDFVRSMRRALDD
jgi:tryptophan synthase alpha chain